MLPTTNNPYELALSENGLVDLYDFIQSWIDEGKAPGAAVGIARNGVLLNPKGFGHLGLTEDSPALPGDAIFLTASITKPVVCAAVVLLIERRLIEIDSPVQDILPEFGQNGKEHVTVRHLLTHTSGLPDMIPENIDYRQRQAPLEDFIKRIYSLELRFKPGTGISYQSTGIAILGEIVQEITGVPLRYFLDEEFFLPLGMADTSLGDHRIDTDRVALIDVPEYQQREPWNWNESYWRGFGAPWGGMFSTVSDINMFTQMFLGNLELPSVILNENSISAMISDQTSCMPGIPSEAGNRQSWGLGWRINKPKTAFCMDASLSHQTFGHYGATGTMTWADPKTGLSMAVFTTGPSFCESDAIRKSSDFLMEAVTDKTKG